MIGAIKPSRRLLVPEVIQTSAMDCGPASLKCLIEGFGDSISYGRLREACQTDVDGTSIDTLEEVAGQLGLDVEQIMIPVDHVLVPEAQALPALVVVRLPNGSTHFVVAWRSHGSFIQIMDPATGRRWPAHAQFLDELYVHRLPVSAVDWREWASSDEFLDVLRRRLENLGVNEKTQVQLISLACSDPGWRPLATLDAAIRMVYALVRSGGIRRGTQASSVLTFSFEQARRTASDENLTIPSAYWSVRPVLSEPGEEEQLLLSGAVLLRVRGRRQADRRLSSGGVDPSAALSPELIAALTEPRSRPGYELLRFLRAEGLFTPIVLLAALILAVAGVVIEAVLFRGLLDLGSMLGLASQRLGAMSALLTFSITLLLLDIPIAIGVLRLGRHVEARLRIAFLRKIPRLSDRYFSSRLISDMAERSHSLHRVRLLSDLGGKLIRAIFELVLTATGIIWLNPAGAPIAILAAVLTICLPLLLLPLLTERDLRVRTHVGALSRFYFDALRGFVAVQAHGAERSIRHAHESLLVTWGRANMKLQYVLMVLHSIQSFFGAGLAAWLVFDYLARVGEGGSVLLLAYWALNLPILGQEIVLLAQQIPDLRNVTLRLLEPLGAPEDKDVMMDACSPVYRAPEVPSTSIKGVAIAVERVSVRVSGHTILEEIDLTVAAGSHIAIVGPSGAGKSSLVGLLLGWHRPANGRVLVDGVPLDGCRLERLRQETAWVDPGVYLWNRSLIDNLCYGSQTDQKLAISRIITQADLYGVLGQLPDGLQSRLGEGGTLVSGGEGQRVRLGRALLRPGIRVVILDEPFRGLDQEQRRTLLARVRQIWHDATLLCITHDIAETRSFARVIVMDGGRIIEDGNPAILAEQPNSRYRAMLRAEDDVRDGLWASTTWRRLQLQEGQLNQEIRKERV